MNPTPLTLQASLDRPRIGRGQSTRVHLVAEISAVKPEGALERPPVALVLALDTSGSMAGRKLEHLVRSVELVVEALRPDDYIGVLCFSDDARVCAPLTKKSGWKRSWLGGLRADGSTHIEAGLQLAAKMSKSSRIDARAAAVLLSDGQPTAGATSPRELTAVVRALRDQVSFSTLGYGNDHSEQVLASIAEVGGGAYAFIPSPEQCRGELARAVGSQAEVVADRVRVTFEAGRGLVPLDEVRLPDLCAGDRRLVCFALDLPAYAELGPATLGVLRVSCRRGGVDCAMLEQRVVAEVAESPGPLDPVAHGLRLSQEAEEVRKRVAQLAEQGRFEAATRELERVINDIRGAPVASSSPALSEALEQLIDDSALMKQRPDAQAQRAYRRGQLAPRAKYRSQILDAAMGDLPAAQLFVLGEPNPDPIPLRGETTIGRTSDADLQLSSGSVSRRHTRIVGAEGEFWVNDLGSSNGTLLNGMKVRSERLRDGDIIEIGEFKLLYRQA
ncbi:MAG: FHA domain-containing protein [Myxococcota bacterium]